MKKIVSLALFAALLYWLSTAMVQVDETQYVMITQFGRPVETVLESGLQWKWPSPFQSVIRFDRRAQTLETPGATGSGEFLTKDKKNVVVGSYTVWRIAENKKDVETFLASMRDKDRANLRLADLVSSQLGAALSRYEFREFVTTSSDEWRWPAIVDEIRSACAERARIDFGIEIVDLQIVRFSFPDQNRQNIFQLMRSERERRSSEFRDKGQVEYDRIRAEGTTEANKIRANADKQAKITIGNADGEAHRIYGEAFGQDLEFYQLLESLETAARAVDEKAVLIFSSDAWFLKPLLQYDERPNGADGAATSGAPAKPVKQPDEDM